MVPSEDMILSMLNTQAQDKEDAFRSEQVEKKFLSTDINPKA